ncbi:MAG TPA: YihA family ribosome biogenesis GTP-binding protein [Candidatus Hydrogenedentes bacterium]|nr:YihA family ribosome biogenesis GTP-binding protein [Candidatus Hydrogenedentota bacterium]
MNAQQVTFVKSVYALSECPKGDIPEIAFVGRSNVGKSSLLNCIINRKGLAKTSSRPGKTQALNFFLMDSQCHFVDLPGYGYAKVPLKMKEDWNRVMFSYLQEREQLGLVIHLVDARHKPTEKDLDMLSILDGAEVPTLIVATKIDKLKRGERKKNLKRIQETLELDDEAVIIPFSSETGEGRNELWTYIGDFCE